MRRYRKTFECIRCEGVILKTADQMISHFRLIHGIKPETFHPKKKKEFYDTFKLADNEYTRDTDEERESDCEDMDPPSPAEDSTHRRYNSLTPEGIPEENSDSVQDMEVAESDSTVVEHTNSTTPYALNDLITSQGTGPYYCPECSKGVGYSIHSFRSHFERSRGLCKSINATKRFHRCRYCMADFSILSSLRDHNARFGGKCKSWQLALNKGDIIDNFNGGVREPIRSTGGVSLKLNELQSLFDNLKAAQGAGPYFCPHCGRGVGCSFTRLKTHISCHEGNCIKAYAEKKFYSCQLCNADFLDLYRVRYHNVKFGNSCNKWEKEFYPENRKALSDKFYFEDTDSDGSGIEPHSHTNFTTDTGEVPANKHTMKITADHLIELPNHLMTKENSVPYYCPDCGKGMGYSFLSFQKHLNKYGRLCREVFAGSTFYSCEYCKADYANQEYFNNHKKTFGKSCKTKQILGNNKMLVKNSAKMKAMKVTENKMLQLSNQTEENTDPYYCQKCGRGLGYSLRSIRVHSSRYKGLCKKRFRGQTLYTCQYCKIDLTSQFNLKSHNRMFGKHCKALQISKNRNFMS